MSCPLARTVKILLGLNIVPVGMFALALPMALASSSRPMPYAESLRGSASMRTAYFAAPKIPTCATPLTVEIRCAIVDSAYSSTVQMGRSGDRSASSTTGWSPGLTFWYDGGVGICGGSCRWVLAIIACTSWAAASMLRLKSNCSVMFVLPSVLVELSEFRPAMLENCFSSGSATDEATVSGLAPGRLAET